MTQSSPSLFPVNPEFKIIQNIASNEIHPNVKLGIGDDTALVNLQGDYLIATDSLVEGTHFKMEWSANLEWVEKAYLANMSDINAMGGASLFILINLGLPKNSSEEIREKISQKIALLNQKYKLFCIGGDTFASQNHIISLTVIGQRIQQNDLNFCRKNAKIGQKVFCSGFLGDSAAGLWLLQNTYENREDFERILIARHLIPSPPLELGAYLAQNYPSQIGACIDTSDSLSLSLEHISRQSNVQIEIDYNLIPTSNEFNQFIKKYLFKRSDFLANSAEDYQIIFTISEPLPFCTHPFYPIGIVQKGLGVLDENLNPIKDQSFSHF